MSLSGLAILLWAVNVIVDTAGQLAFKAAAINDANASGLARWSSMAQHPWLWLGITCYVLEFIFWLAFLSLVPLSQGVLMGAFNIVAIMLAGHFIFNERLTRLRVIGILLVSVGVAIVGLPA